MAPASPNPRLLERFARILEYPGPQVAATARECARLLADESTEAAALLEPFAAYAEAAPLPSLEEAYTSAFELSPAYCAYVGYHLFGESYKRSLFLVGLRELYRSRGLPEGKELPDHLAVILRFLATGDTGTDGEELIREAVLPVLDVMTRKNAGAEGDHETGAHERRRLGLEAYGGVLRALRLWLRGFVSETAAHAVSGGETQRVELPVLGSWPGD
ncbi:MAG: molecular chaperone TorD family protein [Gemmatimonadetes bacterium]|nr:molecular chaperone TorD family protein [Gemmatimonadota bacterium]